MKFMLNVCLAALLAFNLTGCIVVGGSHAEWEDNDWKERQSNNLRIINNLSLQTDRSQVLSLLGAPDFSEAYTRDDAAFRVLYYRTHHQHSDGETSKDETTPLVFKNDKLVGWGTQMLQSVEQH